MTDFKPSEWIPIGPDELSYVGMNADDNSMKLGTKDYLNQAENYLRWELAEELAAGEYDGKPLRWRAMVFRKATALIENHRFLQDHIMVELLNKIEEEALFHHAGQSTAEEMLEHEAEGSSSSYRNNMLNLARIVRYAKQINTKFIEPIDNTCEEFTQIDPDEWFRRKTNRDGSSRLRRLRTAIPEFRRLFGLDKNNSYVPDLKAEAEQEAINNGVEDENLPEEIARRTRGKQRIFAGNIFKAAADHSLTSAQYEQKINIRESKPVIHAHPPNGQGPTWLVNSSMTDPQFGSFKDRNKYAAIFEIEEEG